MGLFGRKKPGGTIAEVTAQLAAHRAAGRTHEAIDAATGLVAMLRKQFGERHASVAANLSVLGELLLKQGSLAQAGERLDQALAAWRAAVGENHPSYARTLGLMADVKVAAGAKDEAIKVLDSAIALLTATEQGEKDPEYDAIRARLAALRLPAGAPPAAAPPVSALPPPQVAPPAAAPPVSVRPSESPARSAPPLRPPEAKPLPAWKTVRVFLSSTFRDMHAERDHLLKVTFPRLRQWCAARRLHLVDIDLRWGVTKEDADNGYAIDICLHEIDGSRPFFLCILGERYGWVPDALPAPGAFAYHDLQSKTGCSITHLEIIHATDNSLAGNPSERRPPSQHAFFYLREPGAVPSVESLASADEASRHLHAQTFFETRADFAERLEGLKGWIRQRFGPDRVRSYRGRWDPKASNPEDPALTGRLTDLDDFGQAVERDLERAITRQFPGHAEISGTLDEVGEERARHEAFLEARTRVYVRRREVEEAITWYVDDTERRPLVVSGPPGSGKSAVLAHWARARALATPDECLVFRFIGASTASTDLYSLLRSIATELIQRLALTGMEVPFDAAAFREQWPGILAAAGKSARVVLVIDALDQLDRSGDPAASGWLLADLPSGVRLVVSAAERSDERSDEQRDMAETWLAWARKRRLPELAVVPLADEEARRIIAELPSVFCKRLDESQIAALLDNTATRNPLYLTVALEELRLFGSFDLLNEAIGALPALPPEGGPTEPVIEALFGQILDRLDRESSRDAQGLVPAFFSLLASAREGLSERELDALLAAALPAVAEPARSGRMQIVLRQMRPYLVYRAVGRTTLVGFFHESFRRAVRTKYLGTPARRESAHGTIAALFGAEPAWLDGLPNERKVTEEPWQRVQAVLARQNDATGEELRKLWAAVEKVLTDVDFIAAKCACSLVPDLEADYEAALAVAPSDAGARDRVEAFSTFARGTAHLLAAFPSETIPLARNYARSGPVAERAQAAADGLTRVWVSRDPRPPAPADRPVLMRTLATGGSRLAATPDGRLAATEAGGTVVVWDVAGGERRCSIRAGGGSTKALAMSSDGTAVAVATGKANLLTTLIGLTSGGPRKADADDPPRVSVWDVATESLVLALPIVAQDVALEAAGRTLVVAVEAGLEIWDLRARTLRNRVTSQGVTRVVLSADGRRAVTAHQDHSVRVWDLETAAELRTLGPHGDRIADLALTGDGRALVTATGSGTLSSNEAAIRVFDADSGACLATFESDAARSSVGDSWKLFGKAFVTAAAISADGRIGVSVGDDEFLRVWDIAGGAAVRAIRGQGKFSGVALMADGRTALTLEEGGYLRLWNLEGEDVVDLEGHDAQVVSEKPVLPGLPAGFPIPENVLAAVRANAVNAIALAGHERMAVSAGADGTTKAWDATTGQRLASFGGHQVEVNDVALNHERLFLSAGGDNTIRVNDAFSGCLRVLQGHTGSVHAIAVAPDGATAVSGASGMGQVPFADHTVRVWDVPSGACLSVLTGHQHWVSGVAIAPDARSVVSGGTDGTIRIWNLSTGTEIRTISPGAGHINRVALSPDGRTIAAATQHGGAMLFDAATGQLERTLAGHAGRLYGVAFDVSGSTLATAGEDGTVRLWRVTTEEALAVYPARGPVRSVSAIRADRLFACGTADGRIHFLTAQNLGMGTPIVTAARRFRRRIPEAVRPDDERPLFDAGARIPGDFEPEPTFDCPWCGATFGVSREISDKIGDYATLLAPDAPALDLAARPEAFSDETLAVACQACGNSLRLNPFFASRPAIEIADWKNDPTLRGRFHPDAPDDIEVLVHDGHPGITGRSPESVWVRVRGRSGTAWKGTLLNQPHNLTSVAKGGEILFVAPSTGTFLIQVSDQYLRERQEWRVGACNKCGITETMSPPSDLLTRTDVPPERRERVRQLTAPCPVCDGEQVLTR